MAQLPRGEQYVAFDGAPLAKDPFIFASDPLPPHSVHAEADRLHFEITGSAAGFILRRVIDFVEVTAVNPQQRDAQYAELYEHVRESQDRGEIILPALSSVALVDPEVRIRAYLDSAIAAVPPEVAEAAVRDNLANLREAVESLASANQDLAVEFAHASEAYEAERASGTKVRAELLAAEIREAKILELVQNGITDPEAIKHILEESKEEVLTGPVPIAWKPGVNTAEVFAKMTERVDLNEIDSSEELAAAES